TCRVLNPCRIGLCCWTWRQPLATPLPYPHPPCPPPEQFPAKSAAHRGCPGPDLSSRTESNAAAIPPRLSAALRAPPPRRTSRIPRTFGGWRIAFRHRFWHRLEPILSTIVPRALALRLHPREAHRLASDQTNRAA